MSARMMLMIAAAGAIAGCEARNAPEPAAEGNAAATADAAAEPASAAPSTVAPVVRAMSDPALQWGDCPAPLPAGCKLAVLNGDPAKPNADVVLRLPAGAAIPPHSHSSAERMMLVSGELEVQYQGAAAATLRPGTYAYGPAGRPHKATCAPAAPCDLFIAFEGPVDVTPYSGAL